MTPAAEKLRLLIVVEDTFFRDMLAAAADASDMFGVITCAEDAHEALAQVWDGVQRQLLPDVIVADLDLPDYNGTQLTCELRRHVETRGIFIALIAETTNELGHSAAETAGADCFGLSSRSVPDMAEVMREVGRRSIAASSVALL